MKSADSTNSAHLADHLSSALDDGKAVAIRVLPVSTMTTITDYMIVATGRSSRQVKALTRRVRDAASALGVRAIGLEGEASAEWVLVDLGDCVVHIMQAEARDFYQLEKLWEEHPKDRAEVG
jgi:ribosome-associated protein